MDRRTYHKLKALSAICKTIWQQQKNIDAASDWTLNHEADSFRSMIKNEREKLRYTVPTSNKRMEERNRIVQAARSMYEHSRKRVSATPGKELDYRLGTVNERLSVSFTVRWGWHRNVYLPFYEKGNLDCHEYFVMAVEKVRVNHPHIDLYEAQAFDFKEKRQRTMWVGQTKIGEKRATIKETSSDAIRTAIMLFDKQFKKDLTERNDGSSKEA